MTPQETKSETEAYLNKDLSSNTAANIFVCDILHKDLQFMALHAVFLHRMITIVK